MKLKQPELFKGLKRGPQIITWKDAALISGFVGLSSGWKVVDAGAGSGFLAIYMGNTVKPKGIVVSYEKRREFVKLAKHNVKKAELDKYVKIVNKDIYKGIVENNVDLITLDLSDPWKAANHAKKALKKNGYIVSYLPNIEQVNKFVKKCERLGLKHIMTIESFLREMMIRKQGTRPQTKGLLHTGYITFIKKV